MTGSEFYLKSEQKCARSSRGVRSYQKISIEVANKCNYELDWTLNNACQKFPDLAGGSLRGALQKECELGLARRYGDDWQKRCHQ